MGSIPTKGTKKTNLYENFPNNNFINCFNLVNCNLSLADFSSNHCRRNILFQKSLKLMKRYITLILILIIIIAAIAIFIFYNKTNAPIKNKCLQWTNFDPDKNAYRWSSDYFKTKNEAIKNCIAVQKDIDNNKDGVIDQDLDKIFQFPK